MEKQKPFYWDFIKKDADLTFRSVFDFVNCKDFTSFMLECQSKKCNVVFYDENISVPLSLVVVREVLQKYPLVLLLLLLPHHPNLPLVSLHLVVPLHPYPVQAHLVVSRLKILLLVQRVLRFLSPPLLPKPLPKALLLLLLRKSLSL